MKNTKVLLSLKGIKKYFPVQAGTVGKKGVLKANDGVSLDIMEGEIFALVGESGSGKSTLGKTLLQLYKPTDGRVVYYGITVDEFVPAYRIRFLKDAEKYRKEYQKNKDSGRFSKAFSQAVSSLGGLVTLPKEDCKKLATLQRAYCILIRAGKSDKAQALREQIQAMERTQSGEFFRFQEKLERGVELTLLTKGELRKLRSRLQVVFQDPYSSLNPRMTVGQTISEGLITHGRMKKGDLKTHEYLVKILRACGLDEYALHRYPHQFSGGQRQRVCIARALALQPQFIVCDECVSALDASVQSQILNVLLDLKKQAGLTYLFISHDLSVVRYLADRVGVMYLGEIMEQGESERVFTAPRHPYTVALISALPKLKGKKGEEIFLKGSLPSPTNAPTGCKFHTRCFMAQEICRRAHPPFTEVEEGHFVSCHFAHTPTREKRELAKKWINEEKDG